MVRHTHYLSVFDHGVALAFRELISKHTLIKNLSHNVNEPVAGAVPTVTMTSPDETSFSTPLILVIAFTLYM